MRLEISRINTLLIFYINLYFCQLAQIRAMAESNPFSYHFPGKLKLRIWKVLLEDHTIFSEATGRQPEPPIKEALKSYTRWLSQTHKKPGI